MVVVAIPGEGQAVDPSGETAPDAELTAVDTDDELFAVIYPDLRRFAAFVASVDTDPDDLLQEVVSRALRRGPLAALENPAAYLRRSIVNQAANERRRFGRRRKAIRNYLVSHSGDRPTEYPSDVADLMRLPADTRAVLWLVDVEGRTFDEAAELLGCSVEAARTRASRARRWLRRAISEEEQ
jgi:RNA polymerase sigma-70 factor (ECF subfamily)